MADGWIDETPCGGWPWEGVEPGPGLAAAVAGVEVDALPGEATASLLKACDRLLGWAQVQAGRAMVAVSDAVTEASRPAPGVVSSDRDAWLGEELAAALRVAPATALGKAAAAEEVLRVHPRLGEAVESGALSWTQASVLGQGVRPLRGLRDDRGRDLAEVALSVLLPDAGRYPPARLRERVAAFVVRLAPQAAAERRRREARDRTGVEWWAESDGMACLAVRGLAPDLLALRGRIHAAADRLRERTADGQPGAAAGQPDAQAGQPGGAGEGEAPTLGQWRVGALLAAFGVTPLDPALAAATASAAAPGATAPTTVGQCSTTAPGASADPGSAADHGPSSRPGHVADPAPPRPEVRILIDLATLFGLVDAPAELEGYGPIDPELARALAADADWVRWVSDPVTGHLLDAGTRRLPTPAMARQVRARDARCSHPTCGRRAAGCDVDHVPAYRRTGRTHMDQLAVACPRHNRRRDQAGWLAEPHPAVDLTGGPAPVWTSPLGQRYATLRSPLLPASPPGRPPPPPQDTDAPPDPDDLPPF
ncbi:MAG: DUF222 domain-containing protein [Candidatus Nanopelagicales bacterium]